MVTTHFLHHLLHLSFSHFGGKPVIVSVSMSVVMPMMVMMVSVTKALHVTFIYSWRLVNFILVEPLVPIDLDALVLALVFGKAWPVLISVVLLLLESEEDVSAFEVPTRLIF